MNDDFVETSNALANEIAFSSAYERSFGQSDPGHALRLQRLLELHQQAIYNRSPRPKAKGVVDRLLNEHRIAIDTALRSRGRAGLAGMEPVGSGQRSGSECNCRGLSGQAIGVDQASGLTIVQTPDGGRFRARSLSNAALLPGQRITNLSLPKGSQIAIANRSNTKKRSR